MKKRIANEILFGSIFVLCFLIGICRIYSNGFNTALVLVGMFGYPLSIPIRMFIWAVKEYANG